jgi:transposase
MLVIFYVERIVNSMKCIQQDNKSILKLMDKLPDAPIFITLPGAVAALSSRLLAAFGEQRDRFKSANEVQQYAGIAPVTERSGQKSGVH